MPGTIPATSQLDRLISMTAINVLAGSRAMRDRLKLFNVCMGSSIGSQRTMDAISTPPPHSIFHHGISKTRWNNLLGDLAVNVTAGSSGHANSPHPSSLEGHHSTVGWTSGFLLLGDLAVNVTAGSSGHANSPHPSSREGHHSTVGWISGFLLSDLIRPVLRLRRPPWSTGTRCHQPRCGAWPTAAPAPRSPSSFRDTWRSSSPKP